MTATLPPPALQHVCDLTIDVGAPLTLGAGRAGLRRVVPIVGGTVQGPSLNGKILNLGGDWLTIFGDGLARLSARYLVETDDGALIEIRDEGYRHGPAEVMARLSTGAEVAADDYYMRSTPRLETGDPRYAWVNRTVFVGHSARLAGKVVISLYAVL